MKAHDLKNSILQLAIQGKLVEQRTDEGSARELLKQIKAEKEQLIKEGKIKREKPLPEIGEDELPFDIPENWEWVRLGEIVSILGDGIHGTPKYDDMGEYYFINGNNLTDGNIEIKDNTKRVDFDEYIKYKKELTGNTVLVSINGTIGNVAFYNNEKVILGKSACYFNLLLEKLKFYVYWIIKTKYFLDYAVKNATGSTIKNVSLATMKNFIVPLPPLEEQKRIVAKIEELMPYVEKYGEAHSKLEEFNKKFPQDMQKSILQYAIQGKLVEQIVEEGTAEELYQQIQAEKAKLIKEDKIKKEKPLEEITEDEIPFEIPESWKWVRLGSLFNVSTGMTPSKSNPLFHENGDIPWITSSQTGELRIERANNFITRFAIESTSLKVYPKHTLLIAMYGQGKTRGQISELLIDATINQACAALENIIDAENLKNYILYFQMYNYDTSRTGAEGSAQPNLNLDKIRNIQVPLPPLEEQKRIVAKIEELMPYCQQLIK